MKPTNILALVSAFRGLSTHVFESYLKNFGVALKDNELLDIESLVNQLRSDSDIMSIHEEFYISFTIEQIGKEFDLLRIGTKCVINIELKSTNTGDAMKKQLIRNKYYLSFLGLEVINFTYVSNEKKIYILDANDELIETDFPYLIKKITEQEIVRIDDINKLFDPTNYLVSPFNSTGSFITGRYFLTNHQEEIKEQIIKMIPQAEPIYISIQGSAGTGKTLLTYDLAKSFKDNSKKVLIIHCGTLNEGHLALITVHKWRIISVRDYVSYDFSKYDVILIDEVQRIYQDQIEDIIQKINLTNNMCIFSFDYQQCLSKWETARNVPDYLNKTVKPILFKLKDKIRTNKEIATFIKKLFDQKRIISPQKFSNIEVCYFTDHRDVVDYINTLKDQGWKDIHFTPSKFDRFPYDKYQKVRADSAHKVVGQEYDKVIAVLDEYFYYDPKGKLDTKGYKTYYDPAKMLFQIVTRARKKLCIVILNNETILAHCLAILNG
jgi:Cdc6-like AAA superfamily ATPase